MEIYGKADKAIKAMNRENLKAFGKLRLAKWDEISLIQAVSETYDNSVTLAKRKYREVAEDTFFWALLESGILEEIARGMARSEITTDWVLDMLEEVDPVTLYAFLPETERKKQRLIEALAVSLHRNAEIDRALRLWARQVGQFAVNTVDRARTDAFRRAGVKKVMWHTEKDDRVCSDCEPLDGKVFDIEDVPPKPHWNCRCWITPVFEDD